MAGDQKQRRWVEERKRKVSLLASRKLFSYLQSNSTAFCSTLCFMATHIGYVTTAVIH